MKSNKMKAAVKTAEGTFEMAEVARPLLRDPGWVIARVVASGICGTDLWDWHKHEPELECTLWDTSFRDRTCGSVFSNIKNGKLRT